MMTPPEQVLIKRRVQISDDGERMKIALKSLKQENSRLSDLIALLSERVILPFPRTSSAAATTRESRGRDARPLWQHYHGKPEVRTDSVQRIAHAEDFFAATGANVVHGGSRACYIPSTDNIHMPCIDLFRDAESYYAVRAHETIHWTRHCSRLDREFGRKRFGDEGYAMEELVAELVAELGSAFLSADLELTPEVREDHAAYIASWIKVLKNDKRAIFTAASHAQRATDFLNGLQKPSSQEAASAQAEAA
jgi:antirestriction protein ArdC